MIEVLTFGEAMAALRGAGPLRLGGTMELSVAGAETNVAIGLARLGHRVGWIGRVGDDETGDLVRRTLRAESVDISAVITDSSRPTGLLLFEHRIGDLVRVAYYRGGSSGSQLCADDVLPSVTKGLRLVHVTGVTAALSTSAPQCVADVANQAHEVAATVSVDINYRSRMWSASSARSALRPLMDVADIVFASVDELPLVADDPDAALESAVHGLLARGVGQVVIKRGAEGASAYTSDSSFSVPTKPIPVVDVVGAGDAFVAGYISALLDDADLPTRLDRGSTTAAFAIARHGDWEGLPTRAELSLLDLPTGTTVR